MPAGRPWEACRVDCPRIFQTRLMWRKRIACRRSAGCTIPNTYSAGFTTRLFGRWEFSRALPETRHGAPDGLRVKKCIRRMYLMTFRPDGAAERRAEALRSRPGLRPTGRSARRSARRGEGAQGLRRCRYPGSGRRRRGGTYRAVYTVECKEAVFLLYGFQCSQKKRKSGIVTPKRTCRSSAPG